MKLITQARVLAILVLFTCKSAFSQTVPVSWEGLKQTSINGTSLTKTGTGIGYATSTNLLYGEKESGFNDGSFTYSVSNNNELKKIGFTVINSDDPTVNHIDYAFDFLKSGNVKLLAGSESINTSYAANDFFKLSREGEMMRFYQNGILVYEVQVDPREQLVIRAELKSQASTFAGVQTSINTMSLEVFANLDHVNNTVNLQVSGGTAPYKYQWSDGENTALTKKYLDGSYEVTIIDNSGSSLTRKYAIGSDVTWADFNQTSQALKTLSGNGSMKWGAAKSDNTILANDKAWVAYQIEEQQDQKAFGFVKTNTILRNFTELEAGFIVSKDNQVQLVKEGRIISTLDYRKNDVLLIERKEQEYIWHINEREIRSEVAPVQELKVGGLVRGSATLKDLHYFINELTPVSMTWDETTGKGAVTVDVSTVTGLTGPFQYFVSKNSIPKLTDVYENLRTQLPDIVVDRTAFLSGKVNETTKTFSNIEMGEYYVSVFDNNGDRVFQESINVGSQITFEEQNGLIADNNTIKATTENGFGSLNLYAETEDNTGLKIKVNDVKGDYFFGVTDESKTVTDYTNLDYGFKLEKTRLHTVVNGIKSTEYLVIKKGAELRLEIKDQKIALKLKERTLYEGELIPGKVVKGGIGGSNGKGLTIKPLKSWKTKTHVHAEIYHVDCDGGLASVRLIVKNSGKLKPSYPFIYELTANDVIVKSGSGYTDYNDLITDVSPGTYVLNVNVEDGTVNGYNYTTEIAVGYNSEWFNVDRYNLTPNTYSLERQYDHDIQYSTALSRNFILSDETGWIKFNPETECSRVNFKNFSSYMIFREMPSYPNQPVTILDFSKPYLGVWGDDVNMLFWEANSSFFTANMDYYSDVSIKIEMSVLEFYTNGNLVGSIDRPAGNLQLHCHSQNPGTGFDNVIMSFGCKKNCKPVTQYPDPETEFPITGVYENSGYPTPNTICPGESREYTVSNFANFARWETTSGTLSCTDCLTTTFTNNGTDAEITVSIFADLYDMLAQDIDKSCIKYTFNVPLENCAVDPCAVFPMLMDGGITITNGANSNEYTAEYQDCYQNQLGFWGANFFSWTPQIGLSCYDCANPVLLNENVANNSIPEQYVVYAFQSQLDKELNRPCAELTINMVKNYCAGNCNFNVQTQPSDLSNLCVGDVVVLTASGEGNYVWSANAGLNCTNCSQTFFTVQSNAATIALSVLNASGQLCGEYDIEIGPSNNCMDVEGISYNNYGVNTNVLMQNSTGAPMTFLNIYGSVINEVVTLDGNLIKGTFTNNSSIAVSKDWINNGLNGLFTNYLTSGKVLLIGNYQRIRGNSPTNFHILGLIGQGKKEQFVDAYVYNHLDLTLNELSTRDNTMFVETADEGAVDRNNSQNSGFVSSNLVEGGLYRRMLPTASYPYLFPLGSSLGTLRYRPVEITPDSEKSVKGRLVNYNPEYDNFITLALDVESINNRFYHQLTSSSEDEDVIVFYYNEFLDGSYQHVAQYEMEFAPNNYWQKTGSIQLGTTSGNYYSPNTKTVETKWAHYNSINFALANAGFIIDWTDFGNSDPVTEGTDGTGGTGGTTGTGDSGITVTVTGPTGTSGGGIGDPNPVGGGQPSGGGDTDDEGGVLFTPSPLAGTYTMSVDGGECIESGEILFDVDAAGNIVPNSIYFRKGSIQMPLAENLYELASTNQYSMNAIFDINSVPSSTFSECTDDVKIVLSNRIKLIPGESFIVEVPTQLAVGAIRIFDAQNVQVAEVLGSNSWNSPVATLEGLYKYELDLQSSSSTITLNGQFIIKN